MEHKFKLGDVVEVIDDGNGCNYMCIGKKVTIIDVGEYTCPHPSKPGYKVSPPIGNTKNGL